MVALRGGGEPAGNVASRFRGPVSRQLGPLGEATVAGWGRARALNGAPVVTYVL
jgi:hypothetical protein